jgi:hypothetical protein
MADTKITALTALTGANSAPDDLLTLVDVSDTTMDAAGTNKKQTRQEFQTYNAGTLTTDVKVLDLSATWNNAGVTFTGLKLNVTNTASNASSRIFELQADGTTRFSVAIDGYTRIASGASIDSISGTWYLRSGSGLRLAINNSPNALYTMASTAFGWSASDVNFSTVDLLLYRDAAETFAQRRTTNAQTFRLYNTWTDASNYERLGISWGSNIVSIKPENAGTGSARVLHISGLPTSNPGPGILWNNGGTPAIGT